MDLPEPDDRLNSWKEIGAFLGRTVRTVQRWEKHEGLPLKRGGPGQRGAVVASKREIEDWWRRRQVEPHDGPVDAGTDPDSTGEATLLRAGLVVGWRSVFAFAGLALVVAIAIGMLVSRRGDDRTESGPRLGRLLAASTSEGRTPAYVPLNGYPSSLVLSPSSRLAYVALPEERAVAVVDLDARRVVEHLDVVEHPEQLAMGPDPGLLFVAGRSELGIFDLNRRTLTRYQTAGGRVHDVYVSRDGRHVWMTLAQAGLKILDIETGSLTTVPTIGCPMYLTPAPRSARLFLSYQCGGPGGRPGHDAIEVIDEIRRSTILARSGPPLVGGRLAISPDEAHVWVDTHDACAIPDYDRVGCPAGSGPVLHALHGDTLDALLTIRVPAQTFLSVPVFFPDGTRLAVAGPGLWVVDRALGTVRESISRRMGFGAFTADRRRFVALDQSRHGLVEFEVTPIQDQEELRNVVSHWTGDGTANDVVGGTHGLGTDGLRFEPGRYGQAFAFSDTSSGVSFGRRIDLDIASDEATYAAWIKPRRTGSSLQIASRSGSQGWSWSITTEGRLAFCLVRAEPELSCENGGLVGQTTVLPGRWSHVGVVRSRGALKLFMDGQEDASKPLAKSSSAFESDPEAVMRLGAGHDGSAPFLGLIDEVLFFRRALSAAHLEQVMRVTRLDTNREGMALASLARTTARAPGAGHSPRR
jgi:hypothetical protein